MTELNERGRARVMRKFGMLFQGGALFDSLRVWENVAFGPIQSDGMDPVKARDIAIAKLGAVGFYGPLFTAAFGDATVTSDRISPLWSSFGPKTLKYFTPTIRPSQPSRCACRSNRCLE